MKQASIMIVEDEALVALSLQKKLEKLGYTVPNVVHSGEDAMQEAEKRPLDLILMDIKLAGKVDGITAAEQIRRHHDIPVVFMTAYSDEETLQRAKLSGPFGYILKPYDERDIRTTVEIALCKHEMEQDREKLIKELQDALDNVKVLSGLLPICAGCKKIRDDKGYWAQVEEYVMAHTDAKFTHGLCPECVPKYFGDTAEKN